MSQYPPPSQPPGGGGSWSPPPPPPPPSQFPQYQPFDSYYRPAPPPQRRRTQGGVLGGILAALAAIWAYGKYALLFLLKFKAFTTLITLAISFGAYAVFWGPWFAAALVLMILVHEMGHVLEIRRQGMQATAPVFIPFLGAGIFQRSHPTDAFHQALIGIAGPIAGTLGATAALVLFGATQWPVFLLAAWIGFYINLFNLVPISPLDGGWILAPVSKWMFLAGIAMLAAAVLFLHLYIGPILILIVLLGIPTLVERFRNDRSAYYTSVPSQYRVLLGLAWLGLVAYLAIAAYQVHGLMAQFVR